jgi:hypothetical protein
MITTRLNSGREVLAKETKYGISAITYANRTQAERRAAEIRSGGTDCHVAGFRPFYVAFDAKKEGGQ